jgi:hypothetical protein
MKATRVSARAEPNRLSIAQISDRAYVGGLSKLQRAVYPSTCSIASAAPVKDRRRRPDQCPRRHPGPRRRGIDRAPLLGWDR